MDGARKALLVALLAGACAYLYSGRPINGHLSEADLLQFENYETIEPDAEEGLKSEEVNRLERQADDAIESSTMNETSVLEYFEQYATSLKSLRHMISVIRPLNGGQSRSRTDPLGLLVHKEGKNLAKTWTLTKDDAKNATLGQYYDLMKDLAASLNDKSQCLKFWIVGTWINRWCNSGDYTLLDKSQSIHKGALDPLIKLGLDYGNPNVPTSRLKWFAKPVKMERVQHAQHLMILSIASNREPTYMDKHVDQVVEFGGGTGDMAALVRDSGFKGMYVVYEMEPMTVLQLYWLRFSGHAAVLGKHVQKWPGVASRATVLQAAEDTTGFRKLLKTDKGTLMRSVFFSFWAFSEADIDAREKIRPDIQNFGRILLAVQFNEDGRYGWEEDKDGKVVGVEVASWFHNFTVDLRETHHTCMWQHKSYPEVKFPAGGYYFMATHKEIGRPLCLKELNCDKTTLHPTIPSSCDPS